MKILIFAEVYYPDVMGGGEFSTKQMAEGLAGKGHEVVIRCLGKNRRREIINGVCVKRMYIKGLSEHFLSNTKNERITDPFTQFDKIIRKWGDIYPSRKIYEIYRSVIIKEAPDIVHTVSPMSYLGRFNLWKVAYDLKIPVSHVCRGPNLLELKFMDGRLDSYNKYRNAKASMYLSALVAPSRYMLMRHNAAGIIGHDINEVIYNAVDFEAEPLYIDRIEQKENLILYAGEIKKEKGIGTLLRATEGLRGVKLLLIGRGNMTGLSDNGIGAEVIDWMERDELFEYMKRAKAVILPSEWEEPFGRILIEAVFNGTIAIGSDKGGIPEVLDHNDKYIFKSGSAAALRRRIERVIKMSPAGYLEEIKSLQTALSGFSNDKYIDKWERFFLKQREL